MPKAKLTPRTADIAERRKVALDRFRDGASLRQIAQELGCSHELVRQDLHAEISSIPKESADAARAVKLAEYETLADQWREQAATDPAAAGVLLKIWESQRKLLGLDLPIRAEFALTGAPIVPVIRFANE